MRGIAKYPAIVKITLLAQFAYLHDVVIRAGFMLVVLVVFAQLWTTTYAAGGLSSVAGFGLTDIIWYLVLTETVVMSAPRVSQKIDQEVKSGDLATNLVRPYHYLLYHLAAYWGEALVRAPVNLALGGAVALLAVGPPRLTPPALPATLLALLLALTINFALEAAIGLTAFWVEETQPFFWIYQKLTFIVGGLFLPLEFLPAGLAALAQALPFAAITYAPARLFVAFSWESAAALLGLQVAWLAVLGLALAWLFTIAARGVQAHGG